MTRSTEATGKTEPDGAMMTIVVEYKGGASILRRCARAGAPIMGRP